MFDFVAKKLFLTKGKGVHEDRLTSFEYALRDAGIAGTNLVLISSIFPPNAKLISDIELVKNPRGIPWSKCATGIFKSKHWSIIASVSVIRYISIMEENLNLLFNFWNFFTVDINKGNSTIKFFFNKGTNKSKKSI